ncbi:kinase-like domain-containing protein [Abortiporus biennis]|nr:kinase-like domain-containing protein [Abortiporus biennis]
MPPAQLNYHLYTQPRPESLQHRFFISDSVREELQKRSETTHAAPPPGLNLPEELQGYHSLVPLEPIVGDRRKFGNWYSTVYRAINSKDGMPYVLRRIENYRLSQQAAFTCIEAWSRIRHPSIVTIKEAFTTRAFSDNSLVVVYEYHPNSQTMNEAHIKQKAPVFHNGRLQSQNVRIAERTLWSYIVQIASAIRTAHEAGLAVRVIDVNKIIVTDRNRIRIAACGLVDVLSFDVHQDLALLQQEDLHMFGKLIYQLCCNNASALNNVVRAVDTVNRHYSQELQNIANDLIQKSGPPRKALHELFAKIQKRVVTDYEESLLAVDRLQGELMSELENGRLVRLLCKFNFINERPEFARDSRWSETGDRYIVKLFRDYVFHQVDEHGRPVVNLSHVLTCLNKLDAGTEERIMLVSRDEQSCLVVSYKEIKSCVESAFRFDHIFRHHSPFSSIAF